tara:strand:- start:229 stop:990 length:762 start_codon:yes stop_codon:yes gene_type:complete
MKTLFRTINIFFRAINKFFKIFFPLFLNNFLIPIYKLYKILFSSLWNKFLLLSTKSKIFVIIFILLIFLVVSFNEENNSIPVAEDTTTTITTLATTTTTTLATTTTSFITPEDVYEPDENNSSVSKNPSQCEVWESETYSNQKLMQLILKDFDEATENYKNNDINSDEFQVILDDLSARSLEVLIKQENLKPNSSNLESSKFYEDSFAGFFSAFNLYSLFLEEGVSQNKIDSDFELELAIENSNNAVLYKSSC